MDKRRYWREAKRLRDRVMEYRARGPAGEPGKDGLKGEKGDPGLPGKDGKDKE